MIKINIREHGIVVTADNGAVNLPFNNNITVYKVKEDGAAYTTVALICNDMYFYLRFNSEVHCSFYYGFIIDALNGVQVVGISAEKVAAKWVGL